VVTENGFTGRSSRQLAHQFARPAALRAACREKRFRGTTSGFCPGFSQANLVAVPNRFAPDFLVFCERNPRPCPVLEVSASPVLGPDSIAPGADLRRDLPRYRVYRDGAMVDEPLEVGNSISTGLSWFLLGCSFGFEAALTDAGIPLRHQDEGRIVPMYVTDRPCVPAGPFRGPLVVSMRPVREERVEDAIRLSGEMPMAHGAPVHAGDPAGLGIRHPETADFGDAGGSRWLLPGEIPLFWACGVTPQAALKNAGLPLAVTHAPGHMFGCDVPVGAEISARPAPLESARS